MSRLTGSDALGLFEAYQAVYVAQEEVVEETQEEIEEAEKWIQKAIKKPGALHKQLGVPEGEKIPAGKLSAAAKKGGKLGKRARLAQTLSGLHKEDVEIDEAVKGADTEMRKAASKERRSGDKRLPPSTGKQYATQQKQSISWHNKATKGKYIHGMVTNEEVDIFDVILSHLLDEGYAETQESALVIMANMSEEWKNGILEAEVLAQKGGVPGSVKVRPSLSIPGTDIGVGPNKPVPGTFTKTTPGQREKIKQGDTSIAPGVSRVGAGPTSSERERYNRKAVETGAKLMSR